MTGRPACTVCGGLEYFEAEGFYYCLECQTQSQELRVEVHEYSNLNEGLSRTWTVQKKQKRTTSEDNNEWTSWELHNFVLKGMVDELIAMGATTKLKLVVLQLWATYLQKLEVAFTSKNKSFKLPKLGMVYHERDARLIYGVGCQKKSKIKRKEINTEHKANTSVATQSGVTSVSKKTDYHRAKRALLKLEHEKSCDQMDLDAYTLLDESMKSFNSSGTIRVKKLKRSYLSSAARDLHSHSRKKSKPYIRSYPENLTRSVLVAIVYIALMICQEKIQLSDIIRWIEAGELSYYEITHFLPEAQKLKGKEILIFGTFRNRIRYSGISETAKDLTSFLNITHISPPDMSLLVTRYVEELQLPVEMVTFVERLMCLTDQLDTLPKKETLQNFEGQAMGCIIVTLKLLLGLDGETEYKISEVGEKLNKFLDNTSESAKLFIWTDWVKYIECRKSLLAQFHFPTQDSLFQDRVLDPSAYISFLNKDKSKNANRKDRLILTHERKNVPEILAAMNNVMQRLQNMESTDAKVPEFVPSFTPQKTALETFMATKPGDFEFAITASSILKQDFTRTSMNYLIEPKEYVALAQENGMEIAVEKNSAQVKVKVVDNITRGNLYGKNKLYEIQSNSEAVFHPSDSSLDRENVLLRSTKRKNVEPGHQSPNKKDKFEFLESSACINSSNNGEVVSENIQSPNEKSGYDSPRNSDCGDHFKSLHHVTRNILLKHLKQNNIKVDHFFKSKKAESDFAESDFPESARMKRSCFSSPRSSEFTECQTSSGNKEAPYKSPKHSKSADHFNNLLLTENILSKYLNKNNLKVVNIPVARENFAFSSSSSSYFDSDKNCRMNNKTNRNQVDPETDSESHFTMYMSNSQYWLYDKSTVRLKSEEFDTRVMTHFPPSFQWLLKECARLLHMSVQELYAEVLNVEHTLLICRHDLSNEDEKKKRKRK